MSLLEMDLFVEAVTKYLELGQPFTLVKDGDELKWEPIYVNHAKKDLEVVQVFSNYLFEKGKIFDFRTLSEKEFHKIRVIVDLLDRLIEDRKAKYPKEGREILEDVEHKLLSFRLGGRVDFDEFKKLDSGFRSFLEVNKVGKKCFALGIQLSENFGIPFEVEKDVILELLWRDLQRQETKDGIRFFYKDQFLMETDKKFLLKENFDFLYRGITFYHPKKALHIAPIEKRNPLQWGRKNLLEVLRFKKGGDSLALFLRKENGTIYCIGVDEGRISAPVKACFEVYQERYQKEIAKEELEAILEAFHLYKIYKKEISEKELFEIVQKQLKLKVLPEKWLVTKNKLLSYLTLPYALLKFFRKRGEYSEYGWKDVFCTPYKVSKVDKEGLKNWIESAF